MKEITGNLITLVQEGNFDIIVHGCNCFNTMGAGIAKEIKERLTDAWKIDQTTKSGDINKLGNFTFVHYPEFLVFNCYTQYRYGKNHDDGDEKPIDYEAITLCLRKINHLYPGKRIGLPLIGCGLAGGDWNIVKKIIEKELKDMDVTIVKL